MSSQTAIEWTDVTDNIIIAAAGGWWCRKCSPGCEHCYAEEVNDSTYFKGNHLPYSGAAPVLKLKETTIAGWARQRLPKRHFVASMTDVFGEWVLKDWCFKFLDGMTAAPLQTFQVLTKRAPRMRDIVKEWLALRGLESVPANIHLGVSVESQEWADIRIPYLLSIPCRVRFLSCEPLIDMVSLNRWLLPAFVPNTGGNQVLAKQRTSTVSVDSNGIGWVIVGGESGRNARPMHPDWARKLRDECRHAEVPFLFKQWGSHMEVPAIQQQGDFELADPGNRFRTCYMRRINKKTAGRVLDGRTWDDFPISPGAVQSR